ncbi:MAG: hypothetical protein AAGL49_04440 [Pseudomonadota bacterium]
MAELPLSARGKRPRFFAAEGVDEMSSMMLELMAELWVVKQRLYIVERAAAQAGLDLPAKAEAYALTAEENAELDAERKRFIASVMRTLEAEHEDREAAQRAIDDAAD